MSSMSAARAMFQAKTTRGQTSSGGGGKDLWTQHANAIVGMESMGRVGDPTCSKLSSCGESLFVCSEVLGAHRTSRSWAWKRGWVDCTLRRKKFLSGERICFFLFPCCAVGCVRLFVCALFSCVLPLVREKWRCAKSGGVGWGDCWFSRRQFSHCFHVHREVARVVRWLVGRSC